MTERPLAAQRQQYQRPHVLIVSDDPELTSFLHEGLPLAGFWTSVIASGLQVMEVFRLRQFDLVVIDAGLTNFDWAELVRRLQGRSHRAVDQDRRTDAPIVIMADRELAFDPTMDIALVAVAPVELEEFAVQLHGIFAAWQEANPYRELADFRSGMRDDSFPP
jgi:CheY-like chemotaxis protein